MVGKLILVDNLEVERIVCLVFHDLEYKLLLEYRVEVVPDRASAIGLLAK